MYNNRFRIALKAQGGVGWTSLPIEICKSMWNHTCEARSTPPLLSVRNEVYYYTIPHGFATFLVKRGLFYITPSQCEARSIIIWIATFHSKRGSTHTALCFQYDRRYIIVFYDIRKFANPCEIVHAKQDLHYCQYESQYEVYYYTIPYGFATFLAKGGNFPGKRLFYITPVVSKITYNVWNFFVYNL